MSDSLNTYFLDIIRDEDKVAVGHKRTRHDHEDSYEAIIDIVNVITTYGYLSTFEYILLPSTAFEEGKCKDLHEIFLREMGKCNTFYLQGDTKSLYRYFFEVVVLIIEQIRPLLYEFTQNHST